MKAQRKEWDKRNNTNEGKKREEQPEDIGECQEESVKGMRKERKGEAEREEGSWKGGKKCE